MRRRLVGFFRGTSRNPPEFWVDIQLTRAINGILGTNIKPWELGSIPDWWLDAFVSSQNLQASMAESGLLKA